MKSYTIINELDYLESVHKFIYVACTNQSTDCVAKELLRIIKQKYLPFVRSTVSDIWIESVNIIEKHYSWYKIEVIFRDIND